MKRNQKLVGFTLIEIMIVVFIIGILLAIAVPNFVRARASARLKSIIANLNQIDSGVEQWAMDQGKADSSTVLQSDLDGTSGAAYISGPVPAWPSGPVSGTYSVTIVGAKATFSGGNGAQTDRYSWEANCGLDPSTCNL